MTGPHSSDVVLPAPSVQPQTLATLPNHDLSACDAKMFTIEQAVAFTTYSRATLYNEMNVGRLPFRQIPGQRGRRLTLGDIREWQSLIQQKGPQLHS